MLKPKVNKPVTAMRGTLCPDVSCGLILKPRLDGATGVVGNTVARFRRVYPSRNSFSVLALKVWFQSAMNCLESLFWLSPNPGSVAPVKGRSSTFGAWLKNATPHSESDELKL